MTLKAFAKQGQGPEKGLDNNMAIWYFYFCYHELKLAKQMYSINIFIFSGLYLS